MAIDPLPIPVTINGNSDFIPRPGSKRWGAYTTKTLYDLATSSLFPSGGSFPLTADVNFGNAFGILAKYFSTADANPATAGHLRLSNSNTIQWRNVANSGNDVLSVDSSNNLLWNGGILNAALGSLADGKIWIGSSGNLPVAQTLTGDVTTTDLGVTSIGTGRIVDAQINASAAIAYSKLNLSGSIKNSDIYSSAAIAYSKLTLTGGIIGTDINASAAIPLTTLAALNTSIVPVTDGSGFITSSTVTATTLGYLDATSSIQTQINSKQATLTIGNLTDVGTDGITIGNGTGAVIGTGTTISQHVADTTHAGYLSSTDWNTFNGKQATLTGTANEIIITGTTLSTPQAIATTSSPTFAALTLTAPLTVPNGGTGDSSLTAYAVLCGGTTSVNPIQSVVGLGSATQVLTSNGPGALPTFQSVSGSGTVNSGTQYQLGYYATTGTAVSGLTLITASRALVSDANGLPIASTVTTTELGYVSGVTSAIQTQLGTKAATTAIKYLQCVTFTTSTVTSTSSGSFVNTSLAVTITPTSASNRIKITAMGILDNTTTTAQVIATIARGSTNLGGSSGLASTYETAGRIVVPCTMSIVDSPATTGATTYTVQVATPSATSVSWGLTNVLQTIIVEEIV